MPIENNKFKNQLVRNGTEYTAQIQKLIAQGDDKNSTERNSSILFLLSSYYKKMLDYARCPKCQENIN